MAVLPVLPVKSIPETVKFYQEVFGFTEVFQQAGPDGTVFVGQVEREGSNIMFNLNPKDADKGGGGIYLWVRVENADLEAFYKKLQEKGLQIVDEIQDQFWGDRYFAVKDANGYIIAFHKKLKK